MFNVQISVAENTFIDHENKISNFSMVRLSYSGNKLRMFSLSSSDIYFFSIFRIQRVAGL